VCFPSTNIQFAIAFDYTNHAIGIEKELIEGEGIPMFLGFNILTIQILANDMHMELS